MLNSYALYSVTADYVESQKKKKELDKKFFSLALFSVFVFVQCVPSGVADPPNATEPSILVLDTILEPESLDPAWANDAASQEVIMNAYEPLLFFDRDYTLGPYAAGKADQFVPKLATSWIEENITETSPEGLTWAKRWTFKIRTGVSFHDGSVLTADDVEYSFERLLVQDRTGGPASILYKPLLNVSKAADPVMDSYWGLKIDHAVENNSTHVWFSLVKPYVSTMFKQILSQTWSSVVEKAWAVALGDFDGNWAAGWATIHAMWHDPPVSFIGDRMMGTGPYRLSFWQPGAYWSIRKFDGYRDGWPARVSEASANERIGGYITTVFWNYFPFWRSRKARFLLGESDLAYVDRQYRDQVLGTNGIRSYYRYDAPPTSTWCRIFTG